MDSLNEFEKSLIVGASTSGLSQDAIRSLGKLAERLDKPEQNLESLLEKLAPQNRSESDSLRRLKDALKDRAYLD